MPPAQTQNVVVCAGSAGAYIVVGFCFFRAGTYIHALGGLAYRSLSCPEDNIELIRTVLVSNYVINYEGNYEGNYCTPPRGHYWYRPKRTYTVLATAQNIVFRTGIGTPSLRPGFPQGKFQGAERGVLISPMNFPKPSSWG